MSGKQAFCCCAEGFVVRNSITFLLTHIKASEALRLPGVKFKGLPDIKEEEESL